MYMCTYIHIYIYIYMHIHIGLCSRLRRPDGGLQDELREVAQQAKEAHVGEDLYIA